MFPFTSKKLEQQLTQASQEGDLGSRIMRNCTRNYLADDQLQYKSARLPIFEQWEKNMPRSQEDLDADRHVYRGNNHVNFLIVPYEDTIPAAAIKIPESYGECFKDSISGQKQVILNKHALIVRQVHTSSDKVTAQTDIGFGDMISNYREPTLALQKAFFTDFVEHPYRYISGNLIFDQKDHRDTPPNRAYPIVLLLPADELNLDEWWKAHEKEMRTSYLSKKEDWSNYPLIYTHIIKPVLEQTGYQGTRCSP